MTQGDLVEISTFHFSVCTTGVKRYSRKVADDTLSDIFFSKSRLMERFQSLQGVHFYEKQEIEDVIGDLEAMSLDFEKYVAKGVIGDLSAVALYISGAN